VAQFDFELAARSFDHSIGCSMKAGGGNDGRRALALREGFPDALWAE